MKKIREVSISVIIPAYNAEQTLPACLSALEEQSVPRERYEITVVNDGSTDHTEKCARGFSRVKVISQPNQGPAAARNRGAQEAEGDILLFTDSDCLPDKNWIEEMIRPFDAPEIVAVKGAYKTHQKEVVARFAQIEFEERYRLQQKSRYIDFVDSYSAAIKREVFWKVGGFDPSFPVANNEDTDLSYRLAKQSYKMVFNPRAIVYHHHPPTLTKYLRTKLCRAYWRMVVYRRFPDKMVKDSYTPQSLKIQIFLFLLIGLSLGLSLWVQEFLYLLSVEGLLFFLTTLPFTVRAFQKDRNVGLVAPFLLFLRSAAFGLGVILSLFARRRT